MLVVIISVTSCMQGNKPVDLDDRGFRISGTVGESLSKPAVGETVELLDNNGRIIDQANTDMAGRFSFEDLLPGNYTVRTGQARENINLTGGSRNIFFKTGACTCCPKY